VRSEDDAAEEERRAERRLPKQTAAVSINKGQRRKEWAVMKLLDSFATGSVGHTTTAARSPLCVDPPVNMHGISTFLQHS